MLTPDTQVAIKKCDSDFAQMWVGQKVCVEGFYQPPTLSADSPLPPLAGPVHLDVNARPVDK